jgi:hypothetical protein
MRSVFDLLEHEQRFINCSSHKLLRWHAGLLRNGKYMGVISWIILGQLPGLSGAKWSISTINRRRKRRRLIRNRNGR